MFHKNFNLLKWLSASPPAIFAGVKCILGHGLSLNLIKWACPDHVWEVYQDQVRCGLWIGADPPSLRSITSPTEFAYQATTNVPSPDVYLSFTGRALPRPVCLHSSLCLHIELHLSSYLALHPLVVIPLDPSPLPPSQHSRSNWAGTLNAFNVALAPCQADVGAVGPGSTPDDW